MTYAGVPTVLGILTSMRQKEKINF